MCICKVNRVEISPWDKGIYVSKSDQDGVCLYDVETNGGFYGVEENMTDPEIRKGMVNFDLHLYDELTGLLKETIPLESCHKLESFDYGDLLLRFCV